MKKISLRLIQFICLMIVCLCASPIFAHAPIAQIREQSSLAPMLKKVMPGIVNIAVEKVTMTDLNQLLPTAPDNDTQVPIKSLAVGSGVIFDAKNGYIVTNAHVIKDQKVIVVTLQNGMRYHGKLIAKSKSYDIAIIQIQAHHLTQVPFGDSDQLHVGDFVTAIGSPFGLSETVTSGVVSALNRSHPQIEGFQSFIQTDAPINPGNSGGALIDMQGKLVGINTAILAPTYANAGIGFAIPSSMAQGVIDQLLKFGKVERGSLGVIVQDLTPALAETMGLNQQKGAIVSEVLPDSPAADAGVKVADIITQVDKHTVNDASALKNMLGLIRPDTTITLTILRDHQPRVVQATVVDPKKLTTPAIPYFDGVRLQDFHEMEADGSKLNGVIIAHVSDNSAAALAGLMPGDVITAINNKPVTALSALQKMAAHKSKPILLTVARNKMQLFVVLRAHA